jgi:hypothetical protein
LLRRNPVSSLMVLPTGLLGFSTSVTHRLDQLGKESLVLV